MVWFHPLRYWPVFIIHGLAWFSLTSDGIASFALVGVLFLLVPFFELILPVSPANDSESQMEVKLKNPLYDWLLYLLVPLLFFQLWTFLVEIQRPDLSGTTIWGKTLTMGVLCGQTGINLGHELGHRKLGWERLLSRLMLLSSLYMHFHIEHNRGHHFKVGTPEDPATAPKGQTVYGFWVRSTILGYMSAWKIQLRLLKKRKSGFFSFRNEMFWGIFIQGGFVAIIFYFFGQQAGGCFLLAALMGILLLETINYIEHYGLMRTQLENGKYERVQDYHSWNANQSIGRRALFELPRHPDHHYKASKKYQVLQNLEGAPQLPTGYPGSMLLSLVPPLWFKLVHPKIPEQIKN